MGAVNPARAIRQQEHRDIGDFFQRAQSPPRKLRVLKLLKSLWIGLGVTIPTPAGKLYRTRTNGIDPYAHGREFKCQCLREMYFRGLGRGVLRTAADRLPARNRRYQQ